MLFKISEKFFKIKTVFPPWMSGRSPEMPHKMVNDVFIYQADALVFQL